MTQDATETRAKPETRDSHHWFCTITARWADNDVYGHINNVAYYTYFDTAVNTLLIEGGALDPAKGSVIGLVVESGCNYFTPLSYPVTLEAGVRIARIGNSSVRYEVSVFVEGSEQSAASGHFVHVYVDRASRRPAKLPDRLRQLLEALSR